MFFETVFGLFFVYQLVKFLRFTFYKPNFQNKLVWVTGASSGIGEALAKDLVASGALVIISSRNFKELDRVKNECKDPSKVTIFTLDMSRPREVLEKS